mmetsp:Transcript_23267/g.37046  ORF Transcript_23267/g.37046 Transcript_23267/m.37046 type:complete len:599 (-) Transcript_23267:336-2132(-)
MNRMAQQVCGRLLLLLISATLMSVAHAKKNVLFVIIDDMRTETKSYGSVDVNTPNLDKFASESIQFQSAHCQMPKCGPSRVSFLTGRNPESINYYFHTSSGSEKKVVKKSYDVVKYFKNQGYETHGVGKIYHFDSSSKMKFEKFTGSSNNLASLSVEGNKCKGKYDHYVCEVEDKTKCTDYHTVEKAKSTLTELGKSSKPWFLAVGIRRPHSHHVHPVEFSREGREASVPVGRPGLGSRVPDLAYRGACQVYQRSAEARALNSKYGQTGVMEASLQRRLRDGYFADVEFVDSLIGDLLGHLEATGMNDNTVVVITADHGYNLGENGEWCKMSLMRRATRVPLWIRDPSHPERHGTLEAAPVQLVDIWATMADLAGVAIEAKTIQRYKLETRSFADLVTGSVTRATWDALGGRNQVAGLASTFPSEAVAFSVLQRCHKVAGCEFEKLKAFDAMGFSVTVKGFRYTEWRKWIGRNIAADWSSDALAIELYNHTADPEEVQNLALTATESQMEIISVLSRYLRTKYVRCSKGKRKSLRTKKLCQQKGPHCALKRRRCHYKANCSAYGTRRACTKGPYFCKWKSRRCSMDTTYTDKYKRRNA